MNNDEFKRKAQLVADIVWTKPKSGIPKEFAGPVVKKLLLNTVACGDCARKCEGKPERTFVRQDNQWLEKCITCRRWRGESGEFTNYKPKPIKRPSVKRPKLLQKSTRQSRPIAPVPSNRSDDHAVCAGHEQDSVSRSLVHPYPVSRDPGDHLKIDIAIHKC